MSTRSYIAIRLHDEDINKCIKGIYGNTLTPKKRYLSVYCHNDGYPDGVGVDLLQMFPNKEPDTYKNLLDFIMKGDRSTTDLSYIEWRNEPWTYVHPQEKDEDEVKVCEEDYLYIYDDTKNGWSVIEYGSDTEYDLGRILDGEDNFEDAEQTETF